MEKSEHSLQHLWMVTMVWKVKMTPVAKDIVGPFSPRFVGFSLPLVKVVVKSGQLNRRYPAE